jgi:hypothetical protein
MNIVSLKMFYNPNFKVMKKSMGFKIRLSTGIVLLITILGVLNSCQKAYNDMTSTGYSTFHPTMTGTVKEN